MKVLSIDIDYVFDKVDEWPNEDNEMWDNWHPTSKWHFYFCKYPDLTITIINFTKKRWASCSL